jgi:DNA repair protein RecO (recombination protein O)
MPGLYRDEGVVLKTIKLGEADRIVTLFTREHGKVRAVAKGIRKTKSRFGGRLEPFTRAELLIYKGRKDLDTITQVDIIDSFDAARRDYELLGAASAMAELVEKITPDREGAFSTYALLIGGLRALTMNKTATVLPSFLIKLLSVSGYHPELKRCAGCGKEGRLGGFSPSFGGAVCESCWHEDHHAVGIAAEHIQTMSLLLSSDIGHPIDSATADAITVALCRYAEHHLERPLRSLQMLTAV